MPWTCAPWLCCRLAFSVCTFRARKVRMEKCRAAMEAATR